ncbi:hypothetical protein [Lacisediminimonas profundi]|uniref:hypothetical protein n=1 Tax=Lacisediminimonas profundi TaxID=2603856 RepID=UPI00140AB0E5|nr:hypothetical protein [Lacisediminimonas profundi]
MMTDLDLDRAYTDLCHALSKIGEKDALTALGRFALLAMLEIDDPDKIAAMITKAVGDE